MLVKNRDGELELGAKHFYGAEAVIRNHFKAAAGATMKLLAEAASG